MRQYLHLYEPTIYSSIQQARQNPHVSILCFSPEIARDRVQLAYHDLPNHNTYAIKDIKVLQKMHSWTLEGTKLIGSTLAGSPPCRVFTIIFDQRQTKLTPSPLSPPPLLPINPPFPTDMSLLPCSAVCGFRSAIVVYAQLSRIPFLRW